MAEFPGPFNIRCHNVRPKVGLDAEYHGTVHNESVCVCLPLCLKKNQNTPRTSEHPPVRGKKMSKRLGGIIGCRYKTSSWHLNGFPYYGSNIGSTVSYRGEAHRYTVHLLILIAMQGHQKNSARQNSTPSNMVVIIYCYIGCEDKEVTTLKREQREDHDVDIFNPESTRHRYSPESRRRAVGDHTRK